MYELDKDGFRFKGKALRTEDWIISDSILQGFACGKKRCYFKNPESKYGWIEMDIETVTLTEKEPIFCEDHKPKREYNWQKGNCIICMKKICSDNQ